jgi:hypothetical protein
MTRHEWHVSPQKVAGLLFEGAPERIRLLDRLIRRPRSPWQRTPLPLVYLVRTAGGPRTGPLAGIGDRFQQTRDQPVVCARATGLPRRAHGEQLGRPVGAGVAAEGGAGVWPTESGTSSTRSLPGWLPPLGGADCGLRRPNVPAKQGPVPQRIRSCVWSVSGAASRCCLPAAWLA